MVILGTVEADLIPTMFGKNKFQENLDPSDGSKHFTIPSHAIKLFPLRGGPNFDPVKYVKEVSHVKHMHANLILIHPSFLRN